MKLLIVP